MLYYDAYLQGIAQNPRRRARNDVEAMIHSQWCESHLWEEVEEQVEIGSDCFQTVEVWKNTVTEFTSNIIKDEKDFRRLMFHDVDKECERGRYYKFNGSFWLVYEGIQPESVYPEVLVRRCNNIAKWIDVETGELVEQPCVLEFDISATNPKVDKDIIVANSSVTLVLQGNDRTRKLKRGQRFIFNGVPYKFIAYNNYMQNSYINQDVSILFMDIDFDTEKPTDDIVNNIADRFEHTFEVLIHEEPHAQATESIGKVTASILYNGDEVVDKYPVWSGNQFVKIDNNGCYKLVGEPGDIAIIYATFGDCSDCIEIEITEKPAQEYEIVVAPLVFELFEQDSVSFTAYLYKDGMPQDDEIDVICSGADSFDCFCLTQNDHNFILRNNHYSKSLLNINFVTEKAQKQLTIKLKSLF